jgi:ABC-type nitrate/sulfonate/bicarbonate transport system substrate-binding protein
MPKGSNAMTRNKMPAHSDVEKIWYTRCPVPTPLGLAVQLGWFIDEFRDSGVGVYSLQDADEPRAGGANTGGYPADCFRQGGSTQAMWTHAHSGQTRVIGLSWIDEYQAIVTLPDRGIRTLRDLLGRRLALPIRRNVDVNAERAATLRGFTLALDLAGIAERQVEYVDVPVDKGPRLWRPDIPKSHLGGLRDIVAALVSGHVDAVFLRGALGAQLAAEQRVRLLIDIRNHPDPAARANHGTPRPITIGQSLLERAPQLVLRFLRRVVEVGDWATAHPAETFSYMVRETGAPAAWVRSAYGADVHLHQRTTLDETSVAGLASFKRFLFERGFIQHDFDINAWIDPKPLQEVQAMRSSRAA